jgi:hypothetical protein
VPGDRTAQPGSVCAPRRAPREATAPLKATRNLDVRDRALLAAGLGHQRVHAPAERFALVEPGLQSGLRCGKRSGCSLRASDHGVVDDLIVVRLRLVHDKHRACAVAAYILTLRR